MTLYNILVAAINFWQKHSGLIDLKTHTLYSKIIDSDSLVIDLGANVGQFSEGITSAYQCQCYALEAVPAVYSQIQENRLVKKFNYAISDRNEPLTIYISDNRECNSISQEAATVYGLQGAISVDGITLETFLKNQKIELIDVLKIDIEGAEEAVFNSTSDATLCNVKQLTIEFHDFVPGSISAEEVKKITSRLKRLGFLCIPFSYLLPEMDTCDFLFINTNLCKIPYQDWLAFQMINLLLTIEKTKSSLVRSAFKQPQQSIAN
ncbi:MAG: FkbM family methyltransferase [Microcoleus sp. CSU_2_2]|nr:FkbM family methyltransferase [Microcoleus sp. SU_5_3]NJS12243.1 FkbM family methyltransferase [Microcoleus sp. CSU_2_2]